MRIDFPDIPQFGNQNSALRGFDQFIHTGRAACHDHVRREWYRLYIVLLSPITRIDEIFNYPVLDPVDLVRCLSVAGPG
ncbi:hypothetical protein D3C87_1954180 [compost metagenome]